MFWVVAFMTLINLPRLVTIIIFIAQGDPVADFGVRGVTRIVVLSCVLLAATARYSPVRVMGTPGFFFLATIALYNIIGTAVSMYHDVEFVPFGTTQIGSLFGMLIVAAVASGFAETASRIGIDRLLRGMLAIFIVVSMIIVATSMLDDFFVWSVDWGRAEGLSDGPNIAAVLACLTVALAGALIAWRGASVLPIVAICVAVPATVTTASRTGMVMLAAVAIMHICFGTKKHGAAAVVPVSLITLAVFAAISWLIVTEPDWLLFAVDLSRMTWDDTSRLLLAQHALSLIGESPIFGQGIDTFIAMRDAPASCGINMQRVDCGAHIMYLLILGEAGILPFTSLLMFFVVAFAKCSWPPDSLPKTVVLGWMLCLTIFSLLQPTIFHDMSFFFIVGTSCGLLSYGGTAARAQDLYEDKSLE